MMRTTMGTAILAGLALGIGGRGTAEAQVGVVARAQACRSGQETGSLGITGLDCRGECTVTVDQDGREVSWSFSVEPRVTGVAVGGPAEGILRPGDELVAIDGALITTAAGGRSYAGVEPNQVVRVRFRREGRTEEATIRAGARCVPLAPSPPAAIAAVGRLAPAPPRPDEAPAAAAVAVAPRVVVAQGVATTDSVRGVIGRTRGVAGVAPSVAGVASMSTPRARLGIGFRCSDCGTFSDESRETVSWFFSGPIEVTAVREGGSAAEAGIQIGDLIEAIDGHPMETEEGGRAFSTIEAGVPVRLTVVKRNGRSVEVRVVPEDETRMVSGVEVTAPTRPASQTPVATTLPRGVVVGPTTGTVVSPATAGIVPPEAPLRYSGSMEGVEVEVRGAPVTVSEMRGERVILIQSQGLWIRIRIPPGRDAPTPQGRER